MAIKGAVNYRLVFRSNVFQLILTLLKFVVCYDIDQVQGNDIYSILIDCSRSYYCSNFSIEEAKLNININKILPTDPLT